MMMFTLSLYLGSYMITFTKGLEENYSTYEEAAAGANNDAKKKNFEVLEKKR